MRSRSRFGEGRSLTTRLHTDRIKVVGQSGRLLAAGEAERYAASVNGEGAAESYL